MLISFFNPSDLIGCGGDINQSDSFRYAERVRGGGMRNGYTKGVCRGVCGGGMQRGVRRWLPLATIDLVGDNREFEV